MPDLDAEPAVWSGRRLRGAPTQLIGLLVAVEIVAGLATVLALVDLRASAGAFGRFALLTVLCLAFEELARRVGRLRLLISTGPMPDMTSVWTFAAAAVLPAGLAALLALVMSVDVWFRYQRAAGQYFYRRAYTAATVVLACLSASWCHQAVQITHLSAPAQELLVTLIALVVYTAVNRLLVVSAARLASPGAPITIVGGWSENALELATLCLGALTAVVVAHEPALVVLVILPMVLLQRAALVKQLEIAAAMDSKTGLLQAVAWQQAAGRELSRLQREQAQGAVLLFDLDHFKAVNDTLGHLVGDAALRAVGARLQRELRQHDVVGRFGGEEFVALLPNLDLPGALAVAERVRLAVADIAAAEYAPDHASPMPLAVSVGLAMFPEHGTELDELLRAADAALYRAKRAGRNRVVIAGGSAGEHEFVNV